MKIGPLKKLIAEYTQDMPVAYSLPVAQEQIPLNCLLGSEITLTYQHEIFCIQCNRKTAKSFQQGYCYPCYRKLMDCNLCIIHPERCKHPEVECPDSWEHHHCKQEHIVYLANSSSIKVGITRQSQRVTRWLDQGAIQAIPLFKVSNRYASGRVEVLLKNYVADKTNWRKMLSKDLTFLDMPLIKREILSKASSEIAALSAELGGVEALEDDSLTFSYPVLDYPAKLSQLNLDKTDTIKGRLLGIKGQYLILDTGVMNIRKHAGYKVAFTA